jgi:hypothetical protein
MKNADKSTGVQLERLATNAESSRTHRVDTESPFRSAPRDVLKSRCEVDRLSARHAPDRSKVCWSSAEQIQRHDRDPSASVAISSKDAEFRAVHARASDSLRWPEQDNVVGSADDSDVFVAIATRSPRVSTTRGGRKRSQSTTVSFLQHAYDTSVCVNRRSAQVLIEEALDSLQDVDRRIVVERQHLHQHDDAHLLPQVHLEELAKDVTRVQITPRELATLRLMADGSQGGRRGLVRLE